MGPIPLIQLPAPKVKGYATLSLYVGHSTFDEPPEMAGINHLLEHVLSCNDDVDKEIARRGLEQNAETHGGYVRYWFSAPPEHFKFCLDFLMRIATKPTFKHVKRESHAVRQELISLLEETDYYTELEALKVLFPKSSYVRGQDAEVMLKTLPKLTTRKIEKYYRANYPRNMFIVISGGPRLKIPGIVSRKTVPRSMVSSRPKMMTDRLPDNKRVVHVRRPEIEKSQCKLIYYSEPIEKGMQETIRERLVMATRILSGGLDSLLYKIMRDKLRLVYSVSCDVDIQPYGVVIEIEWSCDTSKVKRAVEAVQNVVKNFKALHFNGHRNLYLEQLIRENVLTSSDIVDLYGSDLVTWGYYEPIEKVVRRVKKIKPSDVVSSVSIFMDPHRCFLVHASAKKRPPISRI